MELQTKFHSKMPLASTVIAKKNFQAILKSFRQGGFTVSKVDSGYTVHSGRVLVAKAIVGHSGYLVNSMEGLIS